MVMIRELTALRCNRGFKKFNFLVLNLVQKFSQILKRYKIYSKIGLVVILKL